MAKFRLDLGLLNKEEALKNNLLKAIVSIQYPIYSLHCEILDTTPPILYGLDKALIESSESLTQFDDNAIANVLSLPVSAIQKRNEYLVENHYMSQNGKVTDLGLAYMRNEEKDIVQSKSIDILIDGFTLKPLPKNFYNRKYKDSYIFENDFIHFTNSQGETISKKPFSPDLTHQPIKKDLVSSNILSLHSKERNDFNIPTGLTAINSFTYTLGTFPIFIGLFENGGKVFRKLINGFEVDGNNKLLDFFLPNISGRIQNIELRLNELKGKNEHQIFRFETNWQEIDNIKEGENQLFFFSKEDLKSYFSHLYKIGNLEIDNISYNPNSIGLIITREILEQSENKTKILENVKRGSDYTLNPSLSSGVWAILYSFSTGDDYIKNAVELSNFIEEAEEKELPRDKILSKVKTYSYYRQLLIVLKKYKMLEEIDIINHMFQISNEQ
jgi:hypothetical protein